MHNIRAQRYDVPILLLIKIHLHSYIKWCAHKRIKQRNTWTLTGTFDMKFHFSSRHKNHAETLFAPLCVCVCVSCGCSRGTINDNITFRYIFHSRCLHDMTISDHKKSTLNAEVKWLAFIGL